MSDEEDIEEENEDEEEEEDGEEEEGEEEEGEEGEEDGEDEAKQKEIKEKSIQEDIAKIRDIFQYIDRCSVRMVQRLQMEDTIKNLQGHQQLHQQYGGAPNGGAGVQPVAWSNYENLNDAERAELLERALLVLAGDDFR